MVKHDKHWPEYHTAPYNRPFSYKSCKTISLYVKAVKEGHSQRRTAEEYGTPISTLGDHIRGRDLPGTKSGIPKYLTLGAHAHKGYSTHFVCAVCVQFSSTIKPYTEFCK